MTNKELKMAQHAMVGYLVSSALDRVLKDFPDFDIESGYDHTTKRFDSAIALVFSDTHEPVYGFVAGVDFNYHKSSFLMMLVHNLSNPPSLKEYEVKPKRKGIITVDDIEDAYDRLLKDFKRILQNNDIAVSETNKA